MTSRGLRARQAALAAGVLLGGLSVAGCGNSAPTLSGPPSGVSSTVSAPGGSAPGGSTPGGSTPGGSGGPNGSTNSGGSANSGSGGATSGAGGTDNTGGTGSASGTDDGGTPSEVNAGSGGEAALPGDNGLGLGLVLGGLAAAAVAGGLLVRRRGLG